jgi:diguanylate cyclase (GGDEF)-like protein
MQGVPKGNSIAPPGSGPLQHLAAAVRSLQFKGTALVVLLTLSVTIVVSGYLLRSSGEFARAEHQSHLVHVSKLLARAAAASIEASDNDGLQRLANESANGRPLLYVVFFDDRGGRLATAEHQTAVSLRTLEDTSADQAPVPGRPVARAGPDPTTVYLDVTYPITTKTTGEDPDSSTSGIQLLGYVRTGMIADGWQKTMASKLDLLVGIGTLACLAVVPMGFLLIRRIVSPLDGLAEAMLRFSQGQLDVRSRVHRRDEIGRLAEAFNRMADQHQQTHERIVRLNAELEKRVAQRTQQLRELAAREPLTGLFNRRHFGEMLERRFAEALRYETDLSCLMIDLDHFKAVNDEFGHHIGDEVLQITANTITAQLRTSDVPSRYGGDEFVVLLPQTDGDRARVLAERIVERFVDELARLLSNVHVTMSIGIASLPAAEVHNADQLVRLADQALYEAKSRGKNRIVSAANSPRPTIR